MMTLLMKIEPDGIRPRLSRFLLQHLSYQGLQRMMVRGCLTWHPLLPFQLGFTLDRGMVPMVMGHPQLVFRWNAMLNMDFGTLPKGYLQLQGLVHLWHRPHLSSLTAGHYLPLLCIRGANGGFPLPQCHGTLPVVRWTWRLLLCMVVSGFLLEFLPMRGIMSLFLLLELQVSPVATKPYHRRRRSHSSPCPDQVYRADFRVHWDVGMTLLLALMLLGSFHRWHKVMWVILRVGIKVSTYQNSKHGRMMCVCKGKHVLVIFIQMMARQGRWTTIFMWMLEWCHPGLHMMMLLLMDQDVVSVMVSFVNPKRMSRRWGWMSICLNMSMKMCLLHFQIMV